MTEELANTDFSENSLNSILDYYPVVEIIAGSLTIAEVVKLKTACKNLSRKHYNKGYWFEELKINAQPKGCEVTGFQTTPRDDPKGEKGHFKLEKLYESVVECWLDLEYMIERCKGLSLEGIEINKEILGVAKESRTDKIPLCVINCSFPDYEVVPDFCNLFQLVHVFSNGEIPFLNNEFILRLRNRQISFDAIGEFRADVTDTILDHNLLRSNLFALNGYQTNITINGIYEFIKENRHQIAKKTREYHFGRIYVGQGEELAQLPNGLRLVVNQQEHKIFDGSIIVCSFESV